MTDLEAFYINQRIYTLKLRNRQIADQELDEAMEVSTITTNTINTASTVSSPQATASFTMTTTTTTPTIITNNNNNNNNNNNTSQLLSNDNLQSQTQKSPILNTNQASVKSPIRTNNTANNNDNCNNKNESATLISSNHCYEVNNDVNMITVTNKTLTDNNCQNNNQDHAVVGHDQLSTDIKFTIEALLSRVESEYIPITTATTSQSLLFGPNDGPCTTTALITPVVDEDISGTKDIVTLRNLEITPPPQPVEVLKDEQTISTPEPPRFSSKTKSGQKRKGGTTHSETTEKGDESAVSRSKRLRTQTKLFQVGEEEATTKSKQQTSFQAEKASSTRKKPSSTKKSLAKTPTIQHRQQPQHYEPHPQQKQISQDSQDVIHYEKNDYLAIRNEENSFYLCQLTESVRVSRSHVKVKWLDSKDDNKTYFVTSHYDKVPRQSIIVPVDLKKMKNEKKGSQLFTLDDQMRDLIMERLRRSLNVPSAEGE